MTKKVKPAKKAKKPADKTPEITKAAKALENYLKENNLDPAKDWSKDKTHGKAVKELMAKLNKERDKVAAQYPEKDTANQKKLVKMKKASEDEKKAKKEAKAKEKKEKASSGRTATKYDYPLVDGREMTSEEKKKYRMAQKKNWLQVRLQKNLRLRKNLRRNPKRISLLRKIKRPKILRKIKRPKTRINFHFLYLFLLVKLLVVLAWQ